MRNKHQAGVKGYTSAVIQCILPQSEGTPVQNIPIYMFWFYYTHTQSTLWRLV